MEVERRSVALWDARLICGGCECVRGEEGMHVC